LNRNARLLIKLSKDTYYSVKSKQSLSHEINSFGRLLGDDDVIKM